MPVRCTGRPCHRQVCGRNARSGHLIRPRKFRMAFVMPEHFDPPGRSAPCGSACSVAAHRAGREDRAPCRKSTTHRHFGPHGNEPWQHRRRPPACAATGRPPVPTASCDPSAPGLFRCFRLCPRERRGTFHRPGQQTAHVLPTQGGGRSAPSKSTWSFAEPIGERLVFGVQPLPLQTCRRSDRRTEPLTRLIAVKQLTRGVGRGC